MAKEPLTNSQAKDLLVEEWNRALQENAPGPDPLIDELANSKVKSIRYALITQILGKVADPRRSVLAIQLGDGSEGAWDARSFAKEVIVPWEFENKHFLGGSGEPYICQQTTAALSAGRSADERSRQGRLAEACGLPSSAG